MYAKCGFRTDEKHQVQQLIVNNGYTNKQQKESAKSIAIYCYARNLMGLIIS